MPSARDSGAVLAECPGDRAGRWHSFGEDPRQTWLAQKLWSTVNRADPVVGILRVSV